MVASAGSELSQLIGKDGDKEFPDILYLPVWSQAEIHIWIQRERPDVQGLALEKEKEELYNESGLTLPRLVRACMKHKFNDELQKFIRSMTRRNFAGEEVSHKDAHTMVVLRGSPELLDDDEETESDGKGRTAGDAIGWVSSRVETEMCTHNIPQPWSHPALDQRRAPSHSLHF